MKKKHLGLILGLVVLAMSQVYYRLYDQDVTQQSKPGVAAPIPDYRRDDWKQWSDFDGDCMNTRHEMLLAQADGPVKKSPNGCYVSTGLWIDPFSGNQFVRASDLDVDHVIPLKWAHDHGGATWSLKKKELFANDPINLLVVDDGLNQDKSHKAPDEWMPPNQQFHCDYIMIWQQVLAKYGDLKPNGKTQLFIQQKTQACAKSKISG